MPTTAKNPALAWVSARHVQHMIARGEAAGLRMDEVLDEAGLVKAKLADADALVPIAAIEAILSAIAERYADPLMGLHLAYAIQPPTFGVIGHILQTCPTFADVLDVMTRYNGLLSNIGRTSVVREPGAVHVVWECLSGSALLRRHATEYILGAFAVISRLLVPEKTGLLTAVHFAHARPDNADRAREYFDFFKCPVYFGKPYACLVIPSSILQVRMRHGDAFMRDVLERHAQNILRQRVQPSSLADEVRHLIKAMIIEGVPTKDMVAQQLGTSGRSLHRKLEEQGTGYRVILDDVRLELARARLTEGSDPMTRIAEDLGFRSHQAFLRWFKQSAGQTPGEYRQQHKGASA